MFQLILLSFEIHDPKEITKRSLDLYLMIYLI